MTKRIAKTPCLGGIYRITCTANGNSKTYIGSTKTTFAVRRRKHLGELKKGSHCNQYLQRAWDKHGANCFEFHPLEPVKFVEDLISCEQKWMDLYQAYDRSCGFNIIPRADRLCHSEETKARMSASKTGKKLTPEHSAKISAGLIGRKFSPEHIAALTGLKRSPESRKRISLACIGRKMNPEAIAKAAAANTGRVCTAETRSKISAAKTGKKLTPDHVARRVAGQAKNDPFYYRATAPDGTVYDKILSLPQFCRDLGICSKSMRNVASGNHKQYKGWTCQKIAKSDGL